MEGEDTPPEIIEPEVPQQEEIPVDDRDIRIAELLTRIDALEARVASCEGHSHETQHEEKPPSSTHPYFRKIGD